MKLRSKPYVDIEILSIHDFWSNVIVLRDKFDIEVTEYLEDNFVIGFVELYDRYVGESITYDNYMYDRENGVESDLDINELKSFIKRMKVDYQTYRNKLIESGYTDDLAIAEYELVVTREVTLDVRYGGWFDEIKLGGTYTAYVSSDAFENMLNELKELISEMIEIAEVYENSWKTI